jgi:Bacteriophage HK97-gp10, putative tail-component
VAENRLRLDGLAELREALKALPAELVREAGVIVHAQAEAAASEMVSAYPVHTGNLRNHVRVELSSDRPGSSWLQSASARVTNRAKHAAIFEYGTGERRWANGKSTGRMPAGRVFIPIAMQRRRIMLAALIDLVERSGLHVSGAAG